MSLKSYLPIIISVCSLFIFSCNKKENTTSPYGKIQVNIANEVDGVPIVLDTMNYVNAAGNLYSVSLLKYYVSNFTLINDKGEETNFHNYHLVDASDSTTNIFTLDKVANGNYTAIKFYLGVDSSRNHTGNQDGDLDPIHGMIWDWNTGYIFFKHEGTFKNTNTNSNQNLMFHYGTDIALASISIPFSQFDVQSNERKLYLKFNLNDLYVSPNKINFNTDNSHQSTDFSDGKWISDMRENFANAFHFDKVQ